MPDSLPDASANSRYRKLPREEVMSELQELWEKLEQVDAPIGMCHCDVHSENIIYNTETGIKEFEYNCLIEYTENLHNT